MAGLGKNPLVERALADRAARRRAPYVPREAPDEAFTPAGEVRPHYLDLIEALRAADLDAVAATATAAAARAGIAFRTPVGEDAFRIDPVPRLIEREEWDRLERGISQRVRALNAFLADAYGDRRIVEAGRIPARVIDGAVRFEPDACAIPVPGGVYIGVAGLDVVRTESGELQVLEDNLRTPSGCEYATGACEIVDEALPVGAPARVNEPSVAELLGETLRACAPDRCEDPSIVLLTDGPSNSAWWEHRRLAAALAIPLVTPAELEMRRGELVARLDGRAVPVDVVYRRTDEDGLRDDQGRPTWLADLLLEPCREGRVSCVNAFGTGIADDKLVHAYVEEMVRFYLDEEPTLRSVPTYDPAEPSVRAAILDRMDELVVKPRDGYGGEGVVVCAHACDGDRRLAAQSIRTAPEHHVAQETVMFSTHPTVVDGELEPRHVDLRPFAYALPGGGRALPGGLTRVALDEGALVVNSSQNGGGKATWVLA
jgi:carboxylate-amine ligase